MRGCRRSGRRGPRRPGSLRAMTLRPWHLIVLLLVLTVVVFGARIVAAYREGRDGD
jgi:hypothetical protein